MRIDDNVNIIYWNTSIIFNARKICRHQIVNSPNVAGGNVGIAEGNGVGRFVGRLGATYRLNSMLNLPVGDLVGIFLG